LDEKRKARLALLMQIFLRASLPSIFSHQLMSLAGSFFRTQHVFFQILRKSLPPDDVLVPVYARGNAARFKEIASGSGINWKRRIVIRTGKDSFDLRSASGKRFSLKRNYNSKNRVRKI